MALFAVSLWWKACDFATSLEFQYFGGTQKLKMKLVKCFHHSSIFGNQKRSGDIFNTLGFYAICSLGHFWNIFTSGIIRIKFPSNYFSDEEQLQYKFLQRRVAAMVRYKPHSQSSDLLFGQLYIFLGRFKWFLLNTCEYIVYLLLPEF